MGIISLLFFGVSLFSCGEELTEEDNKSKNQFAPFVKDNDGILDHPILNGAIEFNPDSCDKTKPEDWNNFLGIPFGASEFLLDSILGKSNGGTYVNDSLNFVYYYREVDGVPISIWTNSNTTQVEIIYLEVIGIDPYFQADIDSVVQRYNIQECDSKWLGMTIDEVKKIMGEPRKIEDAEEGGDKVKNMFYDSEDYDIAINFRFFESQDYRCSSIMVNWFY